ncbi:MAG: aminomethyltransferase family protein, partial [Geminicoccaceae bacterium]
APEETEPGIDYAFDRQNWFELSGEEHEAARTAAAFFDLSSFAKLLVQGPDAEAMLQHLCANDVGVAPGRCVYTGLLNPRGGYESDLTVTRLDAETFLLVTGSAQAVRDRHWIRRNMPEQAAAVVTDVTSAYAVFAVMGPNARALLSRLTPADLGNEAFPFATMQEIDLGYATVKALRMTYAGELGWELYVPVELAVGVYEDLIGAGRDLGLRHAGYYALESLRIEKAYRAWGHELTPDDTPLEAGLNFAVAFGKGAPFIGRDALLRQKERGIGRRLLMFTLDDPEPVLYGGELILRDGEPVGELESAAYGHTLGCAVGLGYARIEGNGHAPSGSGRYEIDLAGALIPATAHARTPYDPKSERVRA